MKKGIHPKHTEAQVHCSSCGMSFVTMSNRQNIIVEVCSNCHPFYTGEQRFVDSAGRVNKFEEQRKRAQEFKAQAVKKQQDKKEQKTKSTKSLSELLAEMG